MFSTALSQLTGEVMRHSDWMLYREILPGFIQLLAPIVQDAPLFLMGEDELSKKYRDAVYRVVGCRHGAFRDLRNLTTEEQIIPINEAIAVIARCAFFRRHQSRRALKMQIASQRTAHPSFMSFFPGTDGPCVQVRNHRSLQVVMLPRDYTPVDEPELQDHVRIAFNRLIRLQPKSSVVTHEVFAWDQVERFLHVAFPGVDLSETHLVKNLQTELERDRTPETFRVAIRVLAVLIRRACRSPRGRK